MSQEFRQPLESVKDKKMGHPLELGSKRNVALLTSWLGPFHVSELQNSKMIHLFCLEPLSLWQFVTTTIDNKYIYLNYVVNFLKLHL